MRNAYRIEHETTGQVWTDGGPFAVVFSTRDKAATRKARAGLGGAWRIVPNPNAKAR